MSPIEIGLVANVMFVVIAVRIEAIKIVIMFSCHRLGLICTDKL
jgi:hypothetical protein